MNSSKIRKILFMAIVGIFAVGICFNSLAANSNITEDLVDVEFNLSPRKIYTEDCTPASSTAKLTVSAADISAVDIVLLVDYSAKAYNVVEEKILDIQNFVDIISDDLPARFGFVPMGSQNGEDISLTSNYQDIITSIEEQNPTEGVPSIGEAMEKAISMLKEGRPDAGKVIVIITAQGSLEDIVIPTLEAKDSEIATFTVGANGYSPPSLRWIAEKTGGAFYSGLTAGNLEKVYEGSTDKVGIIDKLKGVVARNLTVKLSLSDHARITGAGNLCRLNDRNELTCNLDKLDKGEERTFEFEIRSNEKAPITADIELTYTDFEGNSQESSISYDEILQVENQSPTASFTWERTTEEGEGEIITGEELEFINKSKDCDGSIVNTTWDFGDGTETRLKNPDHRYEEAGAFAVCLRVTDQDGDSNESCSTLNISDPIKVSREISYFIPPELQLGENPGLLLVSDEYNQTYKVKLEMEVTKKLWGLIVREDIAPAISPANIDLEITGEYKNNCSVEEGTIECRFRTMDPGTHTIHYEIGFHPNVEAGLHEIMGDISAFEPFLPQIDIGGDEEIQIINCLSPIRAVYCWDTENAELDSELCSGENTLTEAQLDQAGIWWFEGQSVPGTCDQSITDDIMRTIIECQKKELTAAACLAHYGETVEESSAQNMCINQVTNADLEKIGGIGSVTASNIMQTLPVNSWEELLEVSGVGDETLEAIKDMFDLC